MPPPDPDLPLEASEELQLHAQESWVTSSPRAPQAGDHDESHEINDGEETLADHHHHQVVEFHPDSFVQNDDFGSGEDVIEVVQVQIQCQSPDPENPQEMRVLHFPLSALRVTTVAAPDLVSEVEVENPPADLPLDDDEEDVAQESQEKPSTDHEQYHTKVNHTSPVAEEQATQVKGEEVNQDLEPGPIDNERHGADVQESEDLKDPASPQIVAIEVAVPFPKDRCANCMKLFDSEEEKSSHIFRSVPPGDNITSPKQESTGLPAELPPESSEPTEPEVSNLEALHLIFQLPKEVRRDDEECFLCQKCANILLVLYSAFKDFTELTQEEAYVLRKLKEISAAEETKGKKGKGKRRKQFDSKKTSSSGGVIGTEIKAEVEWEEEDEDVDDEFVTGDFSDDEDFQASPSELAAAGVESSSSSSDDETYVPVKKKRLVRQSRSRKSVSVRNDFFWDNDIKQEAFSDDEFGKRKRKSAKRSGNRKSTLSGLTYDCNLCDGSFLKPRDLKRHLMDFHKKVHRVSFDALHEKSVDGEGLVPSNEEENSEVIVAEYSATVPTCRICKKQFEFRSELKDHFMDDHEGELPFKCDKCDRQFGEMSALKRHEMSHTAEKPYKCRICLSTFRRADHLRAHWSDEHAEHVEEESEKTNTDTPEEKKQKKIKDKSEKSVVPCGVCGKAFARHDHLKLHLRIHTGEKPYKCTECGKAFSDPRGLAYHEVTHSSNRPYCCTICGTTFKRLHHLNDHERNHRDDIERPFACEVCGKCFKYKKHLNSHMVIHGNSKDHQCEICGKAFNRKDNLRQHVKKVHGKEPGPSTMSFVVTTASQLLTTTTSAIVTQALPLDASLDQIVYMHL